MAPRDKEAAAHSGVDASGELPRDLLARSPEEAARLLALRYLAQAESGCRRLARHKRDDEDALHDFRVGLRRLRSCLRSFRPELRESVPKKRRARLGEIADATNAGRDAEVQLAWVRAELPSLPPRLRPWLQPLFDRLAARRRAGYAQARGEAVVAFEALAPRLREGLSHYRAVVSLDGARRPRFADRAARELSSQSRALGRAMARVRGPADLAQAHRARIEAKRLRYLVEPLADGAAGADTVVAVVAVLKGLQDLLGEIHDLHVLAGEVAAAQAEWPRRRAFHELSARVGARMAELFATLLTDWIGAPGPARRHAGTAMLRRQVESVATTIEAAHSGPSDVRAPLQPHHAD